MKTFLKLVTGGLCIAFIVGAALGLVAAPHAVAGCVVGAVLFGILRALLSVTKIL